MRLKGIPKSLAVLVIALVLFPGVSRADSSVDVDRVVATLEPEIQRMMLEGRIPSATIVLVHEDRIIWTGAFGYSNLWAHTPAVPNTVYLIGSTFKTMSTFALLQQMEEGKFKIDDRVNHYLDEFKIQGENRRKPVTFRHLLTHVSGLPADFGPHAVWGNTAPLSLKDYLSKSLKLNSQPMTKVVYSNMAYTLIAYLIEKFAKVPYRKYIQEHIFDPLEMNDTAFAPRPDMEERLAIPYIVDNKTGRLVPTIRLKANVWPAGIVYGTITNQANWLIANLNGGVFKKHRLISEETFNQVMRRQYDKFNGPVSAGWLNASTGYGLTWWISQRKGDTYFAHSGSVTGYTAFMVGNLDEKTGFAILTNGNKVHKHLFDLAIKAIDLMKAYKK